MRIAYKTPNGQVAILCTENDECLWSGRWTVGQQNTRFDELYVHVTKSGKQIFYVAHISFWQGEHSTITVLDAETIGVQGWLQENMNLLDDKEIARLAELGFKLEETA